MDYISYLEEPFVPDSPSTSLSALRRMGVDVASVQRHISETFVSWQLKRLEALANFVRQLQPRPDVVALPECSIPIAVLPVLHQLHADTGALVLAGTHTPSRLKRDRKVYDGIGVTEADLNQLFNKFRARAVLAVMKDGVCRLIPKTLFSPFEKGVTYERDQGLPSLGAVKATSEAGRDFCVLPLICSEALQQHNTQGAYDVACIVSCDAKPSQFTAAISHEVRNQHFVSYVNDGASGGTRFAYPSDERRPDWLHHLPNGLPAGDAFLYGQFDLDVRTIQTGTADPNVGFRLLSVGSIVYPDEADFSVSQEFPRIRGLPGGDARADQLDALSRHVAINSLQRVRVQHLLEGEQCGAPSEDDWDVYGADAVLTEVMSPSSIKRSLIDHVSEHLQAAIFSPKANVGLDVAQGIFKYVNALKRARPKGDEQRGQALHERSHSSAIPIIDRDEEVRSLLEFLDDKREHLFVLTGLQEIGKTAVIEKALLQYRPSARIIRISVARTSSAEFLVEAVAEQADIVRSESDDPRDVFAKVAGQSSLILVERAHLLFEGGRFRNRNIERAFTHLLSASAAAGCKVLVESSRALPEISPDRDIIRRRKRVYGLDREREEYGIDLLCAHLRRVDLSPDVLNEDQKRQLVALLGGHPRALALAAEEIYERGAQALIDDLQKRKGFHLSFVQRLLDALALTDEEHDVLELVALAEGGVPRAGLHAAVDFPAQDVVHGLVSAGALSVERDDYLRIAGVLERHFSGSQVAEERAERLHAACAAHLKTLQDAGPLGVRLGIDLEYHSKAMRQPDLFSSTFVDGALAAVQEFLDRRDYDAAWSAIRPIAETRTDADILRTASICAANVGRIQEALRFAEGALKENRTDTRLLRDLSRFARRHSKGASADEDIVRIAQKLGIEDSFTLTIEGRILQRKGDIAGAEHALTRAMELSERDPWAFYYLGRFLVDRGRSQDAVQVFERGIELIKAQQLRQDAALNALRTQIGLTHLMDGNLDAARIYIEAAFAESSHPETVRAYAALALRSGDVKEAQRSLAEMRKGVHRNRHDQARAHLIYGQFLYELGEKDSARVEFSKAHELDRSNVFIMVSLAEALFELALDKWYSSESGYAHDAEACAEVSRRILDADPENRRALSCLQKLRTRMNYTL